MFYANMGLLIFSGCMLNSNAAEPSCRGPWKSIHPTISSLQELGTVAFVIFLHKNNCFWLFVTKVEKWSTFQHLKTQEQANIIHQSWLCLSAEHHWHKSCIHIELWWSQVSLEMWAQFLISQCCHQAVSINSITCNQMPLAELGWKVEKAQSHADKVWCFSFWVNFLCLWWCLSWNGWLKKGYSKNVAKFERATYHWIYRGSHNNGVKWWI